MSLLEQVARLGGLASRKQLGLLGHRRYAIDRALQDGTLVRVRAGWVATPEANQLSVLAVLSGARLTGPTALRSYGVWNGFDLRTHFQLRPNTCPVRQQPLTPLARFTPPKFVPSGIVSHWAPHAETRPALPAWRVPVADAILRFSRTESDEQVIAAVESAVKEGRLSRSEVPRLMQRMPRRLRRLSVRMTFLAGSGLETVALLRLEDVGLVVRQQVEIGPDTVDIVIDGWLVIELDGDEWHDPVKDRIRTNRLIRAGYRVLRFGHREVFAEWDKTLATIMEMLRTPSGRAG